jgi:hypothetical protein
MAVSALRLYVALVTLPHAPHLPNMMSASRARIRLAVACIDTVSDRLTWRFGRHADATGAFGSGSARSTQTPGMLREEVSSQTETRDVSVTDADGPHDLS